MFTNRRDGGRRLAEKLERYRLERPLVLGLARGGVPVALEVAHALGAPLEVIVVRKLGAPGSPEYAIGAIAEGGGVFIRRDALDEVGLTEADAMALAEQESGELARRVRLYRGGRPLPRVTGRTVILVDDGVATGATARAAARAVREGGAERVILAAPVIAAESEPELREDLDAVVAVDRPDPLLAVGLWYGEFGQVSDEELVACLRYGHAPPRRDADELWDGEWITSPADDPPGETAERSALAIPFDGAPTGSGILDADLVRPEGARGLVVFAHGSGSSRRSPRNRLVASALQRAGLATLLLDLLTPEEAEEDERTARLRWELELLAGRVASVVRWVSAQPRTRGLRVGLFGASTGAAAALAAAAALPDLVGAVVSRGGRPDLVPRAALAAVRAPVLLVVGARDVDVLRLNRSVLRDLGAAELAVVPGATHLFEEPGALDAVSRLAAGWFTRHLAPASLPGPAPAPA